jgi:hypothetical protein
MDGYYPRVMAGLGPATHVLRVLRAPKSWVAGRSLSSGGPLARPVGRP